MNYVAFAPLAELTFAPDLLVIVADLPRAQVVLRSINYSTGRPYVCKAVSLTGHRTDWVPVADAPFCC